MSNVSVGVSHKKNMNMPHDTPARLDFQAQEIAANRLLITVLNFCSDRTLTVHGSDTRPVMSPSKKLLAFVEAVMGCRVPKGQLVYTVPRAVDGSRYGRCMQNVRSQVDREGGEVVWGWSLWAGAHMFEAEWHVVWKTPEGAYINLTPHMDNVSLYGGYFLRDTRYVEDVQPSRVLWK